MAALAMALGIEGTAVAGAEHNAHWVAARTLGTVGGARAAAATGLADSAAAAAAVAVAGRAAWLADARRAAEAARWAPHL